MSDEANKEKDPGTPDFSRTMKGTRHGRTKVSKREFDALAARVEALEKKAKKPTPKKAPAKSKG